MIQSIFQFHPPHLKFFCLPSPQLSELRDISYISVAGVFPSNAFLTQSMPEPDQSLSVKIGMRSIGFALDAARRMTPSSHSSLWGTAYLHTLTNPRINVSNTGTKVLSHIDKSI